jgi:hypothetical protein
VIQNQAICGLILKDRIKKKVGYVKIIEKWDPLVQNLRIRGWCNGNYLLIAIKFRKSDKYKEGNENS